jgi:hypothetical protein
MRVSLTALLVAVVVVAPAGQAQAANNRQERVYFECSNTPIANFDPEPAGWSLTAPTTSLTAGGGCSQVDLAGYSSSVGPVDLTTARWAGKFTGNLATMNVRLDTISFGEVQAGGRAIFEVTLRVDGRDALGGIRRLEVTPITASQGQGRVHTYFFSVVELPYIELEEDRVHTVEFTAEPVNQPLVGWAYGASEVPSGIDFNPNGLHGYKIQPNG